MGASDLALFFQHFGAMGYGVASREDNTAYRTCCSEFLLLKVGDWGGGGGGGGGAGRRGQHTRKAQQLDELTTAAAAAE
jgi:hypothetical protein